jgi:RNA polymerase sigma-70 factor, ECF subfamily
LLYRHAWKMLHDEDLAKDIIQDLFTALYTRIDTLHIYTPLDMYLYKAVRNRVINSFEKSGNRQKYADAIAAVYRDGRSVTDETVLANEMKLRIEQAVAEMPPKMREIYLMSREAQRSRKEIAQATNVSEETVKTQLTRALKHLRSKLTSFFV